MRTIDEGHRISRIIGGMLLLLVGGLLVLQNLGVVRDVGRVWDYWPLLLVWVGLSRMLGPRREHHFASGAVIAALGVFLQLDRLDILWLRLHDFWPLFLVVAGIALIADSLAARRAGRASSGAETGGRA